MMYLNKLRGLFAWPTGSNWAFTLITTLVFAGLAATFGLITGLYTFTPDGLNTEMRSLLLSAAVIFFAPAIFEELAFRGPLLLFPDYFKRGAFGLPALALLALFVAWHPFNAAFILTEARDVFFDWRFLLVATLLGLVASILTVKTRSLWPAIVFHWSTVLGWKLFLGGPDLF